MIGLNVPVGGTKTITSAGYSRYIISVVVTRFVKTSAVRIVHVAVYDTGRA
jgi:hypothetical protein